MLSKITNTPRDYAWGSRTLLVDLGYPDTGKPLAEVWFGTHPLSESRIEATGALLSDEIGHRLGFMLKFLAAELPLSIQVHPNPEQAKQGYELENRLGLSLDDSSRNYKDGSQKVEAIVAVSPFELLVGFRPITQVRDLLESLSKHLNEDAAKLAQTYLAQVSNTDDLSGLVAHILDGEIKANQVELLQQMRNLLGDIPSVDHPLLRTLFENFGLDRGILVALLMNKFELAPGEAVFVAAGVPHSYLSGLGVEILNSSDNVVRGGLTPKKVSASEFVSLLDFGASDTAPQSPRDIVAGLSRYDFPTDDFSLSRVSVSGSNMLVDFKLPAESVMVCTSGELDVTNSLEERVRLRRGEAAYLSADANFFTIAGSGEGLIGSGRLLS